MSVAIAPKPLLGDLRQIDAGPLNVGYVDRGPADGPAVVLLHGWPYDIHSYADVVPLLIAAVREDLTFGHSTSYVDNMPMPRKEASRSEATQ